MNDNNLKPFNKRTENEQREIAVMGGIASGKSRKEKAEIKRAMQALLEDEIYTDENGHVLSGAEKLSLEIFNKALSGNLKAFEIVRDTAGQSIVQKVQVSEVSEEIISEVERAVLFDE